MDVKKIILILMCAGTFILLSASVGGNNWLDKGGNHQGLWRACVKFLGSTVCGEFEMSNVSGKFHACRAFAAISLLLTVVGGIIAFVRLCKELDGKIVGGFFLAAGVCMLIALSVYIDLMRGLADYSWSFTFGWISVVLCFATGVISIVIK